MHNCFRVVLVLLVINFLGCSHKKIEKSDTASPQKNIENRTPQKKEVSAVKSKNKDLKQPAVEHKKNVNLVITPKNKKQLLSGTETYLRLVAFFDGNTKQPKVGLVNIKMKDSRIVAVGDYFEHYKVISINYNKESVVLEDKSSRIELFMEKGTQESATDSTASNKIISAIPVDIRSKKPTIYKPTKSEIERGIDPNDYKTWPNDYRGPAIERALQKNLLNRQTPATYHIETNINKLPANFVPTEDEINRGIDPNDASTWPGNYRGPAIERAMQDNK